MRVGELLLASALLVAAGAPALAQDQGPPVSVVFAVTTGPDPRAEAQFNESVRALEAYANGFKGSTCKGRHLQGTFAGTNAGTHILVIDCPNMQAFLQDGRILNADPQFRQLNSDVMAKVQAAGGKLVSQSVYQEVR